MTAQLRNSDFADQLYRANAAPWDIDECQPAIRHLTARGVIRGHVLDPGCGTGWQAIEYAQASCTVTGIDSAMTAIVRARRNTRAAGVANVRYHLGDVTAKLAAYDGQFDTVVDSKLYDNLDSLAARQQYAAALHRATKPGGRLIMFVFGPGRINGVHNHEAEESDAETVVPSAGFTVTYTGPSTYQLKVKCYRPVCDACPRTLPNGRMHIPVTEIHALRI